jgi:archaellum component FlaC
MKKRTVAVASLLILSLAASAFAQRGPGGPRPDADDDGPEMEEPGDRPMARARGPHPGGPMGPGRDERDPAVEKEAMDYLKKQVPGIDEELERLQKDRPAVFRQKFRQYMTAYREPNRRDEVVQGLKTEFNVRRLVKAVRQAKGDEKEKVKKDLEKALSEQFDSNLARMEARLKKMQETIAELKTRIEKRRAVKSQIVKKRLGELTGEVETWEW